MYTSVHWYKCFICLLCLSVVRKLHNVLCSLQYGFKWVVVSEMLVVVVCNNNVEYWIPLDDAADIQISVIVWRCIFKLHLFFISIKSLKRKITVIGCWWVTLFQLQGGDTSCLICLSFRAWGTSPLGWLTCRHSVSKSAHLSVSSWLQSLGELL